jgi:hypothetical protein
MTNFLRTLFAMLVNIPWATQTKALREIKHVYEIRPRKDKREVDLISDVLPFGRLWYGDITAVANAIGYAEHFSRSHDAVIRVYDHVGNA